MTAREGQSGSYEIDWDGRSRNGFQVPDGIYFIRLEVADRAKVVTRVVRLR
jgi:hypothetical protein